MTAARTRAAQLRGVFVGAISGVTAVAGHGFGGAHLPGSATVVLVVLCSAVVGAVAAAVTTRRVPVVIACLAIGQVLGHYLLGVVGEHSHATQWSSAMLAAHLAAAFVAAALICTAEGLFGAVATSVWRLVLVLIALRDSAQRLPTPSTWGVPAFAVRTRAGCGRVTRGPPSFAA